MPRIIVEKVGIFSNIAKPAESLAQPHRLDYLRGMSLSEEPWQRIYNAAREEMERLPTFDVRADYRVLPPYAGYRTTGLSPGWGDEIIALWVPASVEANVHDEAPGGARFPRTKLSGSAPASVCIHSRSGVRIVDLDLLELDFCHVQPMPDGHILVAGSRCSYSTSTGAQSNAALYDAGGALVRTGTLGDGINHLRSSENGDIWVGYFDEGVFGNYGWGSAGGPEPIGASGLVRFDASFEKTWEFSAPGWNSISDCYALERDGSDVWVCYYTDFNIARIRDEKISVWINNDVSGARSLVVADGYVGLIGGYLGFHDRVAVGRLVDWTFRLESQLRIVLPGGAEVPQASHVFGADGGIIVVLPDGAVYRASFAEWTAQQSVDDV